MTEPTEEPFLKPCRVCNRTMQLAREDSARRPWYYVDGRHDVDCPFNIHFRPIRYATSEEAINEWNGRPIK